MKLLFALFFLGLSCATFSQVKLDKGLMAYYPFTGNAKDSSGNKNDVVFNNARLTADRAGNPNSAYHFNGINTFMQIRNASSLNMQRQISLCMYIRPTGFYGGDCHGNSVIMKGETEGETGNYILRFDDASYLNGNNCDGALIHINRETFYGNSDIFPAYNQYIVLNHWYSVVYTYDGAVARLYVNNTLVKTTPVPGLTFTNAADLYIGKTPFPNFPYWFTGDLDEFRIYNRAINSKEVKLYGEYKTPGKTKDSIAKKETELISFTANPAPDNKYIRLKWSARNENAGNYTIERNSKGAVDYKIVKTQVMRQKTGVNAYSFYDFDVLPDIVYEYEIHYLEGDKPHSVKVNSKTKSKGQKNH